MCVCADCMCAFAVIYRDKGQTNEKLLSFMLDTVEVRKSDMLTELCKTIANAVCRTDFVSYTLCNPSPLLSSCLCSKCG